MKTRPILALITLLFSGMPPAPAAAPSRECASARGLEFLCGPENVEDLVAIPGRHLLIASGLAASDASAGKLYLIDADARTYEEIVPQVKAKPLEAYASCPSPLDLSVFRPHGVAIRGEPGGPDFLYVVNHGGRESIEMFTIDGDARPVLTWAGCVVLPDGASGNAVAPLPDGGFLATKFFDTRKGRFFEQLGSTRKTGTLYRWHPGSGFTEVRGATGSGDNGVEVSRDGRSAYVNLWVEKRIVRVSLDGSAPPKKLPVDFMPDNVRLAPDGSLLVGGHVSDIHTLAACKRLECPVDWAVARLDPATGRIEYLLWEKGTADFAGVTGAAELDGSLWLSTYHGDRVAIVKLPTPALK